MKTVTGEKCYICGCMADFVIRKDAVLFREAQCNCCGASLRNSDIAKIIVQVMLGKDAALRESRQDFTNISILNTTSSGAIHQVLVGLPGYVCGEYLDGIMLGHYYKGILCIDLRRLSFPDNCFDLVISEDVFEHIDGWESAVNEINRVLKMGGRHIITVPVHEGRKTISRNGLQPVYHGDPLREEGILVVNDFGDDFPYLIDSLGMKTSRFDMHRFYSNSEITNADAEYEQYKKERNDLIKFFRYNCIVFDSVKAMHYKDEVNSVSLNSTGERFIPNQYEPLCVSEHLQRYNAIMQIIKGKIVLDAACGEGYGSAAMAIDAESVIGVDLAEEAIYNARKKYKRENLSFLKASVTDLPLADQSVDVVISYETIEHIPNDAQHDFLLQVKRVLKPGGTMVISTPDKLHYSDIPNYSNRFHIKEFYSEEFRSFLQQYFKYVKFFFQGINTYGIITDGESDCIPTSPSVLATLNNPKYIIAVCSDDAQEEAMNISSAVRVDGDDISGLYIDYGEGLCETNKLYSNLKLDGRNFSVDFDLLLGARITALRWDPLEGRCFRCHISHIDAGSSNVEVLTTNAWRVRDGYEEFLTSDPSYYLSGEFDKISHIHIEGTIDFYDEFTIGEAVKGFAEFNNTKLADFEKAKEILVREVDELKQEQELVINELNIKNKIVIELEQQQERLNSVIQSLYLSKSWRFTKPLRSITRWIKFFRNN